MKQLKQFLEDRGWTQRLLAERCDIGEDTLSKIIKGRRVATLEVLMKISRITGLPIDELAAESERNRRKLQI